jgi:hypothetical protein
MALDLERLRSINQGGRTAGLVKVESQGSGERIHYADGRIEAVVRPPTVRRTVSIGSGEVLSDG